MPPVSAFVGANHHSVKQSNRATIFRAIHALGPIARVDLARQTGLNAGTVSNIVDELLEGGLASETGYRSSNRAGRRAVQLEINPSARYALGLDLARNAVTGALVDLAGEVREHIVEPGSLWRGEVTTDAAHQVVERLLAVLPGAERDAVVGIGIGVPSPAGARSRRYLSPQSFGTWEDLSLADELKQQHGLPTYVDNNANTSTLAELWFGAGQHVPDFVLLTLGTGVGAGLVLGGDLYRGDHDLAGEAGHVSVNLDGPSCACGNDGCLEMYVSVPRVLDRIQAALDDGEASVLRDPVGKGVEEEGELTIAAAITALHDGDRLAERVFADVARHLAAGIVNIIYTLDPQLILLGRELSAAGDALLEPVRTEVRRRIFPAMRDTVQVEATALPHAPVVGAATLALHEFFQAPLERRPALAP